VPVDPSGETVADDEPAPVALVAGGKLGKYALLRMLGRGGMGVVWAAHDPDLDREVALKLLHRGGDEAARARLQREARAMAKLKHPNVLVVYEVGSAGPRDFIAMELVDGDSLHAWLDGKPSRREIVAALLAAGRGLAAAHAVGLVHRDFKPHNVLRSRDGRVLVTDFGLARGPADDEIRAAPAPGVALEDTVAATPSSGKLTQTGALVGTPAYMSPEQFAGAAPDPRTDQFAFCVTAWQALAGKRPFTGATLDELADAVARGVAGVEAELPRRVRAVLARGLDPDPARRWPKLDDLLAALERATSSRRWIALAGVAGVAVVGVSIAIALAVTRDRAPARLAECDAPDRTFGDTWTPARRAGLLDRTGAAELATQLDGERREWLAGLAKACSVPADPQLHARIACLVDQRDRIAAETTMLDALSADRVRAIDALELPHAGACASKTPTVAPPVPDELRAQVAELRVALAGFRELRGDERDAADLVARAAGIGWPPLVAEIQNAAAFRALAREDFAAAREHFRAAAATAAAASLPHIEHAARAGLVEVALHALANPQDAGELDRLLADARAALARAGDGSGGTHLLQFLDAWAAAGQGRVDGAIAPLDDARRWYLDQGDVRRLAEVTRIEIDALLVLGSAHDLDKADEIGRAALAKAVVGHRSVEERGLRPVLDTIAFRRGALDELHRGAARETPSGTARRCRVIASDGKPAAGARVVAWQGVLLGDRGRVDSAAAASVAVSDANGDVSIVVPEHGALIAELGEERSPPQLAVAGELVLHLDTTKNVANEKLDFRGIAPTRLSAFAAYRLAGGVAWVERTAFTPSGGYDLDRLPAVPFVVGIIADVGPNATRTTTWPGGIEASWQGRRFDVIVHGPRARHAHVWVLAGQHAPRDLRELRALLPGVADYVEATTTPIGALDADDFARSRYHADDEHAVFLGPTTDPVTACAAADAADAPLDCIAGKGAGDRVIRLEAP
jgi:predicted Ser/Thr protein kinase